MIPSKRIKYLEVHLTKEVKHLCIENYTTFMKEIKEHMNKWKDTPCSWADNTVKMSIASSVIYRFKTIFLKILIALVAEMEKKNTKIHLEPQKIQNIQS
jgi:hypothetical protein